MIKKLLTAILVLSFVAVPATMQERTHVTTGATLPSNCSVGDLYQKTGASAGFYSCNATDTWVVVDLISASNTLINKTMSGASNTFSAIPVASIANIAGLSVLANATNSTAAVAAVTGTDGQVFRVSGTALGFGTIATAGIANNAVTLAKLATQSDLTILSNISGGAAVPSANTISGILDATIGTTQGAVVTRQASAWVSLSPGTTGFFLKSQGAAANLVWAAVPGGGDALVGNPLSQFASTTSAQLAGVISNETGTSLLVYNTNPTLAVPLINGYRTAFAAKTADYTVTSADSFISCDATGGNVTLTLPTAASISGTTYTVKKIDSSANTCIVDANSAETIDGAATWTIGQQWEAETFVATASTTWNVSSAAGYPLADPGHDAIMGWDDSAGHVDWFTFSGCSITGTTITCSGSGDVSAASNFGTDNVLVRSDGTSKGVQSTGVVVDDSNVMSGVTQFTMANGGALRTTVTSGNTLTLSGYDTSAYVALLTITNAATPTLDLATGATVNSSLIATAANTLTLTGKTINTASNVLIMPIFAPFSIAGCTDGTGGTGFNTGSSGAATITCNGSTVIVPMLSFDDATTNEVQFAIDLPPDWDSTATHTITGFWRTSATANNVNFSVSGVCAANGEVIPTAYSSTADTTTDTTAGTTLFQNTFSITLSTSANHALATCAAGERFYVRFFRDVSADALGAAAEVISLNFITGVSK